MPLQREFPRAVYVKLGEERQQPQEESLPIAFLPTLATQESVCGNLELM